MTLAAQLSLITMESLQNELQIHFKVLTLMLLPDHRQAVEFTVDLTVSLLVLLKGIGSYWKHASFCAFRYEVVARVPGVAVQNRIHGIDFGVISQC